MLTPEKIEKNYNTFVLLCGRLGERAPFVTKMLEHLGDRLVLAPASSREQYHAAYPGGLVEHSLHVFQNARKLKDAYGFDDISIESIIIGCLFHDLGKVGDLNDSLYIDQDEKWRREKNGENYKINKAIQWMPTSERGLWLMQSFGIVLSQDEWIAIRCNDGMYVEENKPYSMKEPPLALLVHHADRISCEQEKA